MASEPIVKIEQGPVVSRVEGLPEKTPESKPEQLAAEVIVEKKAETSQASSADQSSITPAKIVVDDYHQQRELEVDNILSAGLGETFLNLAPDKQKLFKEEGEKTVKKINILLDAAKVNVNKIITLIRRWLSIIPGVNRFFLDQEAKIKADQIIKIKK